MPSAKEIAITAAAWASLTGEENAPVTLAAFAERLVVRGPPYDYDVKSGVDPFIELLRPHDMTFAAYKQALASGTSPERCICSECVLLRGAVTFTRVRRAVSEDTFRVPKIGDLVRAFRVPGNVREASLLVASDVVWTKAPDDDRWITLAPSEFVPISPILSEIRLRLEPEVGTEADSRETTVEVEAIYVVPEAAQKIHEIDLGIYQKYRDRSF